MTHQELHDFFTSRGWQMKPNSTAYYHDAHPTTRYKVNKLVLRKERKGSVTGDWFRVSSGYINHISVNAVGKLEGMHT